MRNVFVFDLDGVLADSDAERIALIQPDGSCDWPKYYACDFRKDGYNAAAWFCLSAVLAIPDSCIVLLTSRSESARAQTVEWIQTLLGPTPSERIVLIMRRSDDERPAHVIKPEYLSDLGAPPNRVAFVIDDEPKNVEALQAAGYFALLYQRKIGG